MKIRLTILSASLVAVALAPAAAMGKSGAVARDASSTQTFGQATLAPSTSESSLQFTVETATLPVDDSAIDMKTRMGTALKDASFSGEGSGTESDPWIISQDNEWSEIVASGESFVGCYFKISEDYSLDFSEEEEVTPLDYFNGSIDGNGTTIKLGTRTVSSEKTAVLFNYLGLKSCISNFTVEGDVTITANFGGTLIGKTCGTVENVVSNVTVTQINGAQNGGGLIGYTYGEAQITNCSYTGTFTTAGRSSGGVIGQAFMTYITNCYNAGTMTAPLDSADLYIIYTGGVVGYAHQSTLTGCYNKGVINTMANGSGGVAGYVGDSSVVTNCYNIGTVTSTGQFLGGVAGRLIESEMSGCYNASTGTVSASEVNTAGVLAYSYYSTVSNCWNEGSVSASKSNLAGVIAHPSHSTVTGCYNASTGNVTGTSYYVGGVAYRLQTTTMSDCYNAGTVLMDFTSDEDKGSSGGVTAAIDTTSTMTNCYNIGTFTTTDGNFCGGVVGFVNNMEGNTVSGCYNTGTVTLGQSYSGGVIGYLGTGATAENCYNTGTITITNPYCAGVVGRTAGGTITGCYSTDASTITTKNSAVAGVLGYGYGATVTDCWNATDIYTNGNSSGGVVGMVHSSSTISGCYNLATVKSPIDETSSLANSFYIGGVVGRIEGGNDGYDGGTDSVNVVTNCWNAGDVYGGGYDNYAGVGGIVGYTFFAGDTISNCFNVGNITSYLINAGGIAGWCKGTVTDVYSMGTITSDNYSGGLVGNATSNCSLGNGYFAGTIVVNESDGQGGNTVGTTDGTYSSTYYQKANAFSGAVDSNATGLTYADLATLSLNSGSTSTWTSIDDYSYPVLTNLADNDYAKAYSAAVVPVNDEDTYSSITGNVYLGGSVTWSTDADSLAFYIDSSGSPSVGYFPSDGGYEVTVTATSGDVSVSTTLIANITTTGVETIENGLSDTGREIVKEEYYTTSGVLVADPAESQKSIYIVRRVYDDGSVVTAKEVR